MSLPEEHRNDTYRRIKKVDKSKVADWLLNHGYYPEQIENPT